MAQVTLDQIEFAVERMARAAAKDSIPNNGMFNEDQRDYMLSERLPAYRQIARVMLAELFSPVTR